MKNLLLGILAVIGIIIAGFVYRNAAEHPSQPIACPLDALVCPDGTSVARTGSSCTFPACPPPNVSLSSLGISFAIPSGFSATDVPDTTIVAAYASDTVASTSLARILIRSYPIAASSTALATIQQTAINGASGMPVSTTSFTSTVLGGRRFTIVQIERFEGNIDTAYYLARAADVLRFDAIDTSTDWTNPNLDIASLPAHVALAKLLATLQGQ
jgi:hypothetical protein